MPIREYECPVCGFRCERIEFTPDDTLPICPRAVEHDQDTREMQKAISRTAFALRGGGWTRPSTYDSPRRVVPDSFNEYD